MLLAAGAAGALAGFAVGVLATVARVPTATLGVVVVTIVAAVVLDAVVHLAGRPHAPAVRTQVPAEWATLLPLPTAAALYGARLGVGPLTLATPWTWWAASALGASGGALTGTAVGAAFGAARIMTILSVSRLAERAMPARMARLRRLEPAVSGALAMVTIVAAGAALVWAGRP